MDVCWEAHALVEAENTADQVLSYSVGEHASQGAQS